MGDTIPHYWTVAELSARLKVVPQTVTRWCKSGKVEAYRVGREWLIADDVAEKLVEERNARWVVW